MGLETKKLRINGVEYDLDSDDTGTSSAYGHVKLSDNYKTSDGTADSGVAASSKAVADAYAEINSNLIKMKATYETVRFTPDTTTVSLPANTVTKFGYITIPANCMAVIMFNAHNRTSQPDLEFGIATSDSIENIMWDGTHQKVTQFYSASNTWTHYNNSSSSININIFGKASIDTVLMYAICHALCVPILN